MSSLTIRTEAEQRLADLATDCGMPDKDCNGCTLVVLNGVYWSMWDGIWEFYDRRVDRWIKVDRTRALD